MNSFLTIRDVGNVLRIQVIATFPNPTLRVESFVFKEA